MKNRVIIVSFFSLMSCGNKENNTESEVLSDTENVLELTDEQLKSFTLSSTSLQEKTITQTLKLNGMVDVPPQNLVSVSMALGGYVKSTKLLPGSHFRKGEVLAVMEDNQYIQLQQDYLTAKVQLENAKKEYNRQKELNQSKASSDKVYQQAKANYETLLISKQALEEKLRLISVNPDKISAENISREVNIYAPFDGYVTAVFVNAGKYVSPSEVLFELVNPKDMLLNLKVFEKDWDKITIGQPLMAYTNSNSSKKYPAKIILIGRNISQDRVVEVHAHFDEDNQFLIPGIYVNADIEIPETKALALPVESILSFEGKKYVFKMLDTNKFEMVAIQVGNTGNGWVEIKTPEKLEKAKVIEEGAYTLLMTLKNKGDE